MSIHSSQPRKYNWWLFGLSVLFIAYVIFIGLQVPMTSNTEPSQDGARALALMFAGVAAGGYGVSLAIPDMRWFAWTPCLGAIAMSAFLFAGSVFAY